MKMIMTEVYDVDITMSEMEEVEIGVVGRTCRKWMSFFLMLSSLS